MAEPALAYIGLGSNLDDPQQQIQLAFQALSRLPHTQLERRSPLYLSDPMGPQDQPRFVNAVAELRTQLSPHALLQALNRVELAQGRQRVRHWGPRSLDLDILLYDDLTVDSDELSIPHPGLYQRNFVLYPLADIAPDLVLPDGSRLRDRLLQCSASGLEKIASAE